MKTVCYIPVSQEEVRSAHLLIEIGDFGFSFLWCGKETKTLLGLAVFVIEEQDDFTEVFHAALQSKEIKNAKPLSLQICYNYRESLLVPDKYFKEDLAGKMLDLVFGERENLLVKFDHIGDLGLKNVYRMPSQSENLLKDYFNDTETAHSTSLQIRKNHSSSFMDCIVFYDAIKISLYINGQLHFVQQFKYANPEDVTYFLLNTCQQHDISPEEIHLKLCGMIVEDSNLYRHLYNYFLNIEFVGLPEGLNLRSEIESLPAHFFSHLIEMASCV